MASSFYLNTLMARPGIAETLADNINRRAAAEKMRQDKEAAQEAIARGWSQPIEQVDSARQQRRIAELPEEMRSNQESIDLIRKNPLAVVHKGKVYRDRNEAESAHIQSIREKATNDAMAKRQAELDKIEEARLAAVARVNLLRKQAPAQFKAIGLEAEDITPEMLDTVNMNLDEQVAKADEEARQARDAALGLKGKQGYAQAAARHAELGRAAQQLSDIRDAVKAGRGGEGSSYSQSKAAFRRSVDDDVAGVLQDYLVNDPMPVAEDPRRRDREIAQARQAMIPGLIGAMAVEPELGKVFMESIKADDRQGDAGIEAERKAEAERQKQYTTLLSRYSQYAKDATASMERYQIALAKLEIARDDLERKKGSDAAKKAYMEAKADTDAWKVQIDNSTRLLMNERDNLARVEAASLGRQDYWTSEGAGNMDRVRARFTKPELGENQSSVSGYRSDLFARGQRATSVPLKTGTKPGEPGLLGAGDPEPINVRAPLPDYLPPVDGGPAKGKRDRKDLKAKERPLSADQKAFLTKAGKNPANYYIDNSSGIPVLTERGK